MIAYLLAAVLSCDPALTALFTPIRPSLGRYDVCTTPDPLERVAERDGELQFRASEMLDPLDAFGSAGPYNRAALARLYIGMRVRVARGWAQHGDRFESATLLSPYPDATLTRLVPGTMMIRWTLSR
jgi:hypothetical protein